MGAEMNYWFYLGVVKHARAPNAGVLYWELARWWTVDRGAASSSCFFGAEGFPTAKRIATLDRFFYRHVITRNSVKRWN